MVRVYVINPAVGDGPEEAEVNTTGFGVPKFVRLKMLKNSARNCRLNLSESLVAFKNDAYPVPPFPDQ